MKRSAEADARRPATAVGRATAAVLLVLVVAGCGEQTERARAAAVPPVAILTYHHLGDPPRGERNPSLWTTPRRFAQHLDALDRAGFHAVTLKQLWRAWHGGPALPARPVVITFDDGYAEHDTIARPALRRHGWRGVLNLQLNQVGAHGGLPRTALHRLVASGWEIDDHSATHPDLTRVSAARLTAEVSGSRTTLRRRFGIHTTFFCYPYGRVDARVRAAVRAAGFLAATTITPGLATASDDPLRLPRLIVRRTTTPSALVALAADR